MIKSSMSSFQQRLLSGSAASLIFLLLLTFAHHELFCYFVLIITTALITLTLWEFFQLAIQKGYQPSVKTALLGSSCFIFLHFFEMQFSLPAFTSHTTLLLTAFGFFLSHLTDIKNAIVNISTSIMGLMFVTYPLHYLLKILYFPFSHQVTLGAFWLLYLVVVTKMTDTAAYFFGKTFGRRKLAPTISPGKTIEGAIGGSVAGLLSSIFLYWACKYLVLPVEMSFTEALLLGLTLSSLGQLGDLSESLLKRDAQVKDSAHLPGLGGLLDTFDSLIFTAPPLYLFLEIFHTP